MLLPATLGGLLFLFAPRLFRTSTLLEIDAARGALLSSARVGGATGGAPIRLGGIGAVRGVYETQGWDGRSVVYALPADGAEPVPVLVLPGTDERLAEETCRTLGRLLDRPATYAGPFGGVKTCYTPGREATSAA